MNEYNIAVLPGDGIGREVMTATLDVMQHLAKTHGVKLRFTTYAAGAQHYQDTGVALPEVVLRHCERADAILFGAMGLPHVRYPDGTEIIPQLDLRFHFDLYAGVRPIKTFPGLPTPLSHPKAQQIDLVLVRESTEGLFYARGRGQANGDQEVLDTMKITRTGTARVCEFAFALAQARKARGLPGRVTCVDKANVFMSMAFFRKIFEEVAAKHSGIAFDSAYVDAMALNLVLKPWNYDVLVTENMFGDILSDLIAALVGGMGMAPSADIGDKHALFQPAHGTAPDIAGQGKANPTAMLLSAAMMLEWLGHRHADAHAQQASAALQDAIQQVFATHRVQPCEFGGADGTTAIAGAVAAQLSRQH
ncbi:MAG: isocitrate/isopropylmalate dehydrogenase family protein [Burkholderiaceae bacterium]